jgi:hypothetical protein
MRRAAGVVCGTAPAHSAGGRSRSLDSNPACMDARRGTHEEYDAVRTRPTCFVVLPDDAHVLTDVEDVVERHERYWVVEKTGVAAELAERRARLQATHSE